MIFVIFIFANSVNKLTTKVNSRQTSLYNIDIIDNILLTMIDIVINLNFNIFNCISYA